MRDREMKDGESGAGGRRIGSRLGIEQGRWLMVVPRVL